MNKHLQVLSNSLMAGVVGMILFIVLVFILGAFVFSFNFFGFVVEINAIYLAMFITIILTISTATHIYEIGRLDRLEDERKNKLIY